MSTPHEPTGDRTGPTAPEQQTGEMGIDSAGVDSPPDAAPVDGSSTPQPRNPESSAPEPDDRSGPAEQPNPFTQQDPNHDLQPGYQPQPMPFTQPQQYGHPEQYGQQQYAQPIPADQQQYAQVPPGHGQTAPAGRQEAGFFKSLFDLRFDNFIAVRWSGIIFIIAIVVAVLWWVGIIIGGIVTGVSAGGPTYDYSSGYSEGPGFTPIPLILAILFGWILPLLWVIFVRLGLELIVSTVKTNQNTKAIADSLNR